MVASEPTTSTSTVTTSKEVSLNTPKVTDTSSSSVSTVKKETSPVVWVLLGLLIALLIGGLVIFLLFTTGMICQVPGFENTSSCVVEEDDTDNESDSEDFITVTSPKEGATLDGSFTVTGTTSVGVDQVEAKIFTADGQEIEAERSADTESKYTLYIGLMEAPTTSEGYILVFPSAEDETSDLAEKVNVKFDILALGSVGGQQRLKVTSPIANQLINNATETLLIKGQMKDFFEGQLNFKLVDEDGTEMYKGYATASGDNYDKFSNFSVTVEITDGILSKSTGDGTPQEGKLVFYDVSMKDGSETTILELPVTLNTDLQM